MAQGQPKTTEISLPSLWLLVCSWDFVLRHRHWIFGIHLYHVTAAWTHRVTNQTSNLRFPNFWPSLQIGTTSVTAPKEGACSAARRPLQTSTWAKGPRLCSHCHEAGPAGASLASVLLSKPWSIPRSRGRTPAPAQALFRHWEMSISRHYWEMQTTPAALAQRCLL